MDDVRSRGRESSGEPNPKLLKPDKEAEAETPPEDRFNSLPEPLLIHIVSFLPLPDVISLATVSKRWQYLWTMVPNLVFDQPPFRADKHIAFVNQTLALRRVPKIEKFSLPLYCRFVPASEFDRWIDFAIKSSVDDLELRVDNPSFSGTDYILPEQLYNVSSLRKLMLISTSVMPIGSIRWNSLKTLHMDRIIVSDETLDNMMKGCPVLEFLEMRLVVGFKRLHSNSLKGLVWDCSLRREDWFLHSEEGDDPDLEISAPHIQSLRICDRRRGIIPVLSSPLLVDAADLYIDVPYCDHGRGDCLENHERSLQLFKNLCHVVRLGIGSSLIQVMSMWKVKELPSPLPNCKYLSLNAGVFKWEIPGIANLLQSVPHLESLTICFTYFQRYCESCNSDGECYEALEQTIALDHLKVVRIYMIREELDELDLKLVQFLLKNAKALEEMVFYSGREGSGEEVSEGSELEELVKSKELLQGAASVFSSLRSSPNARVVFMCRDYNYILGSYQGTITGYAKPLYSGSYKFFWEFMSLVNGKFV